MKISNDTMALLSLVACNGNRAVIVEQLERKDYVTVNKVLEALGGKWSKKDRVHLFPSDAGELLDAVMLAGEVTTKRDTGFFPTPPPLAKLLVDRLGVKPGMLALEPSAGTGNIVAPLLQAGAEVIAIERNEEMRTALAKIRAGETPHITVPHIDNFMRFRARDEARVIDVVAMNPPFCKSGEGDHLDHVRHALGLLKKGGRLGAILPAGVQFRKDKRHRELRELLQSLGTIESLPPLSFRASGTDVSTCLALVTK
jgi:type I restriction-modification system DNA methylase subunit